MIGIFSITNRKGQVYVGKSINMERRMKNLINSCGKSTSLLHKSFTLYGIERHFGSVLEECDIRDLHEREGYWVRKFNRKGLSLNDVKYQYKGMRCRKCGNEHFIKNKYIERCKVVSGIKAKNDQKLENKG